MPLPLRSLRFPLRVTCVVAGLCAVGVLCLAALSGTTRPTAPSDGIPAGTPRLLVLVVFDQLRGDYLTRWGDHFGEGGFRRLQSEGAWFQNCHYPYANTVTAAGHASLMTGCDPSRHGIVGNEWFDRESGKVISCVATDRYQRVPSPVPIGSSIDFFGIKTSSGGASPDLLLAPTLADALSKTNPGSGRVVSLSVKDRSAILPVGRRPDACCYWLDPKTGAFVTSTYYGGRLHKWVAAFNRDRLADRWFGKDWTALRPDLDDLPAAGAPYFAGSNTAVLSGRHFLHPLKGSGERPDAGYYRALVNSPHGNELLLDLAKRAIDAEDLGRRDATDLLCLSFSSNDAVGHVWGPDSQEVLDVTLRSDHVVRDLLNHLDARVGHGRYLLALTADHGVCPVPERITGQEAGRVPPFLWASEAEEFLQERFARGAKGRWLAGTCFPWMYLDRHALKRRGVNAAEVEEALARWLEDRPGILKAYSRTQLEAGLPDDDEIGRRVRASFHPDRCGDVGVVLKPYYCVTQLEKGTNHGSPHFYDTHVPLLVYGPDIPAGTFSEPVTPQAVAAIFSRAAGLRGSAAGDAPVPLSLQRD